MRTFQLGLAGGCLNSGYGLVPLNSLYHRRLAHEFRGRVRLRTRIANIERIDPAANLQAVRNLLDRQPLDGLLFNIRPPLLWALSTAVWSTYSDKPGPGRLRLRTLRCRDGEWSTSGNLRPIGKLTRLNWNLARWTGLERHGWQCLDDLLTEVRDGCQRHGVRLALMGPAFGSWYDPDFAITAEPRAAAMADSLGLPYISLADRLPATDRELWSNDGAHLLAPAHQRVSESLMPVISEWLEPVEGG